MPYKHANGCTCMTMPEFLNDLGKREGKTGGEVMTDIMEDMASDDRKQEQYWKDNPDNLFKEFGCWNWDLNDIEIKKVGKRITLERFRRIMAILEEA